MAGCLLSPSTQICLSGLCFLYNLRMVSPLLAYCQLIYVFSSTILLSTPASPLPSSCSNQFSAVAHNQFPALVSVLSYSQAAFAPHTLFCLTLFEHKQNQSLLPVPLSISTSFLSTSLPSPSLSSSKPEFLVQFLYVVSLRISYFLFCFSLPIPSLFLSQISLS